MSGKATIILDSRQQRERAIRWINQAPPATRLDFIEPKRTLDQNARLWAMLTDVAVQSPQFNGTTGRKYSTDEIKATMMHACGHEIEILPSLDGKKFFAYGHSSSRLTVKEMSELIAFMEAWGVENGIEWSDPQEQTA